MRTIKIIYFSRAYACSNFLSHIKHLLPPPINSQSSPPLPFRHQIIYLLVCVWKSKGDCNKSKKVGRKYDVVSKDKDDWLIPFDDRFIHSIRTRTRKWRPYVLKYIRLPLPKLLLAGIPWHHVPFIFRKRLKIKNSRNDILRFSFVPSTHLRNSNQLAPCGKELRAGSGPAD